MTGTAGLHQARSAAHIAAALPAAQVGRLCCCEHQLVANPYHEP
jgi:hypothetical protein